jgi:cytochrome c-type biogenesis protein CcmH/NrfF
MRNRPVAFVLLLLAFIFFTTACASSEAITITLSPDSTTGLNAARLVEERCTVCHSINRIQTARHSAADWKTVVDTMIARGANLNPEEETLVINWLAATYGP